MLGNKEVNRCYSMVCPSHVVNKDKVLWELRGQASNWNSLALMGQRRWRSFLKVLHLADSWPASKLSQAKGKGKCMCETPGGERMVCLGIAKKKKEKKNLFLDHRIWEYKWQEICWGLEADSEARTRTCELFYGLFHGLELILTM